MTDLRFALRQARLRPGFHALLILTFALGIGLNTALFTVVNALLLRAIPGYETDRLVTIWQRHGPPGQDQTVNGATVRLWRSRATSFEQIEAGANDRFNLSGAGLPEVVQGADVTAGYFSLYRAQAMLGRTFLPGEDSPGRNRVVVLSHAFWQRKFGGDTNVIGRILRLDRRACQVVGVMPADFHPLAAGLADVYLPLAMDDLSAWDFWTVARLRSGISLERAQAEMAAIPDPVRKGFEGHVVRLRDTMRKDVRQGLWTLFGAVSLVLLIGCANTANLLLARSSSRAREFALRLTLGADQRRLARQIVTEGLVLAAAGGILGAILGGWGLRLLIRANANLLPRLEEVSIDTRVVAFAIAATVLSALLSTLAPALSLLRHDLNAAIRSHRGGYALVVSEIALTFVLVAGSLLALQSFQRLARVPLGYDPSRLLSMDISSPAAPDSDGAGVLALYRRIVSRLETLPGVRAVELATHPPIGGIGITFPVQIAGCPAPPRDTPEAHTNIVSPGYFRALSIPILRGRAFTAADRRGSAPAVIVNDAVARHFFPGADPIGQKLLIKTFDPNITRLEQPVPREIVGVAGVIKEEDLKEQAPFQIYIPLEQNPISFVSILIRTAGDPAALALTAQREIAREDKDLPASDVRPMEEKLRGVLAAPRQAAAFFGGFALLAVVLAMLGIYGVLSYAVSTRTQEIGIRMALGASPAGVMRLVLGDSLRRAAAGIAIGGAAAFFGIHATDPKTLAIVTLVITAVALAAAWIPASRAASVDPTTAVRTE